MEAVKVPLAILGWSIMHFVFPIKILACPGLPGAFQGRGAANRAKGASRAAGANCAKEPFCYVLFFLQLIFSIIKTLKF